MKSFAAALLAIAAQATKLGKYYEYEPIITEDTVYETSKHYDPYEVTRFSSEPRLTYDTVNTDLLAPRRNTVVDTEYDTYYKGFDRKLTRKVPVTIVEDIFIDQELVHAHSSGSDDHSHFALTYTSDGTHSHSLGYDNETSDCGYDCYERQPFSLDNYVYYGTHATEKKSIGPKIAIRERPNYLDGRLYSSDDSSDYHSVGEFPLGFGRPKGKNFYSHEESDYGYKYSSHTEYSESYDASDLHIHKYQEKEQQ